MITLLLLLHATYVYGVVLHAHSVRGESHNQRNTTGEVATVPSMDLQGPYFSGFKDPLFSDSTDLNQFPKTP